jgi:hypothetical protein
VQVMPARPMPGRARPPWPPGPAAPAAAGEIVVAGAHGGAGVSTLAALLPPAWDMGTPRAAHRGFPPLRTGGRPVVLVTRNTVPAAGRAVAAVSALTRAGGWIAVLAVVGDGLPEPAEAAYRFRLITPPVGGIVRVPFIPLLRLTDDPGGVPLPRRARAALAEIRALTRAAPAPIRRR